MKDDGFKNPRPSGRGVVNHNVREFERVPGLQVEDWLQAA
jgi:predicted nucleic acid-binding protein